MRRRDELRVVHGKFLIEHVHMAGLAAEQIRARRHDAAGDEDVPVHRRHTWHENGERPGELLT